MICLTARTRDVGLTSALNRGALDYARADGSSALLAGDLLRIVSAFIAAIVRGRYPHHNTRLYGGVGKRRQPDCVRRGNADCCVIPTREKRVLVVGRTR